jgi:hypothetical protein
VSVHFEYVRYTLNKSAVHQGLPIPYPMVGLDPDSDIFSSMCEYIEKTSFLKAFLSTKESNNSRLELGLDLG